MGSLLLLVGSIGSLRAQLVPSEGPGLGAVAADRARVLHLLGRDSLTPTRRRAGGSSELLPSELRVIGNSDLPYSMNDGSLWSGRGFNVSLTPAGAITFGNDRVHVRVIAAPTFSFSQNRPFQIFPGRDAARSPFSSPWHSGAASADLPLRFGDESIRTVDLGQSSVRVALADWTIGAGVQNEWWGPGIRNTLVMSNNAAGIPHLFLQPSHGLRARIGILDGRLMVGTLTKSRFFDTLEASNYRSISGMVVTFRPAVDTGLTLGFSRAVYAALSHAGGAISHGFDVVTKWEPMAGAADTLGDGRSRQRTDQITSLFGRWEFPGSGFEVYGELARMELPRSLRDWLVAPTHTLGYVVGTQLARPTRAPGSFVRVQLEMLNLEQSIAFSDRPPPDFYTGRATVQGYTQRGQIIGAASGPGSSSQWLAADYFTPLWQAGVFVGRTRWENDALYRLADPRLTRHDVTIYSGVRGGLRSGWFDALAELTVGRRLNYLFQNEAILLGEENVVSTNVQNVTLSIVLTSR